jgi:hypothetical protein
MGRDILEETSREFKRAAAPVAATRRGPSESEKFGHLLTDKLSNV